MPRAAILAAPAFLLGCAALPGLEEVQHAGVSLTYSTVDFAQVGLRMEARRIVPPGDGVDEGYFPAHSCFDLRDKRPLPALGEGPRYFFPTYSFICVVPLEDASVGDFRRAYPGLSVAAADLRWMLRERPGRPARTRDVPDIPPRNAGHSVLGKFQYLGFRSGSGILFLTQYSNEMQPNPLNNEELTLVFQGLTNDGRHYVAAHLAITHPSLPRGIDFTDQIERDGHWRYLQSAEVQLEGFPEESFQPSLKRLKALLSSIRVER